MNRTCRHHLFLYAAVLYPPRYFSSLPLLPGVSCGSGQRCWSSHSPAGPQWLQGWIQGWLWKVCLLKCCCCLWGQVPWGLPGWHAWPCDPGAGWESCSGLHTAGTTAPHQVPSHGPCCSLSTPAHGVSEHGRAGTSVWWSLEYNNNSDQNKELI